MTNERAVLLLYPEAPLIRTFSSDSPHCNSALFNNSLADLGRAPDGGLVDVVIKQQPRQFVLNVSPRNSSTAEREVTLMMRIFVQCVHECVCVRSLGSAIADR